MELCNDDWTSGISILLIEIIRENGKIRLDDLYAIRMVQDSIIRLVLFDIFNI